MAGSQQHQRIAAYDRVLRLLGEPTTRLESLERELLSCPELADSVLRAVNSSRSGLRNPVTTLQRAITMLGLRNLRERF